MAKKEKVEGADNLYTESEITPYMDRERASGNLPGSGKRGGLMKSKKMASGGSASSRADGIATKGKTRGKMC
jgi:hypothetical protein